MPIAATSRGGLYFADHRNAKSPPLLLIHGAAGTHLDWSMPLRKAGSIAVDLNGHGKSPGYGRETIAEYAEDMIALLDALDIPMAFVCGHSMGGAVALTMALEHPERLRGAVLISTGARLRVHPDILSQAESNPAAVAEILFSWLWAAETAEAVRARGRALFLAQKPSVIARDYLACDAFDVRASLHHIKTPVLVLCGTADAMTPVKYSQALAQGIAGAVLHLFEGAGHNLQLEQADAVTDEVHRFIGAH